MSAKNNRSIHFPDPKNKSNGSMYRSVLCDKRTVYLEYETQKGISYRSFDQGYYTRDKNKVTCKNCKRLVEGKKKGSWLGDSRWETCFVGTKKLGVWIVIGDGALKKVFPGASRKNREEAQRIVNEENRKLADEVKHGNV